MGNGQSYRFPASISLLSSHFFNSFLFLFFLSTILRPLLLLFLPFVPTSSLDCGPPVVAAFENISAFENRFKWVDRLLRAEPNSAPSRDALFINLPWTRDARHIFESLPFPFKKTLSVFKNDVEKINRRCMFALGEFDQQLKKQDENDEKEKDSSLQRWALKMVDSFGRPTSGFFEGGNLWTGNFDECLRIQKSLSKLHPESLMIPNYCYTKLSRQAESEFTIDQVTNNSVIYLGTCFPQVCQDADIEHILKHGFEDKNSRFSVESDCQQPLTLDTKAIIAIGFILIVSMITLVGSLGDYLSEAPDEVLKNLSKEKKSPSLSRQLFHAFSIQKNYRKLTTFNNQQNGSHVTNLHGIRVLSLLWIINGHSYNYIVPLLRNVVHTASTAAMSPVFSLLVREAPLGVASFFVLSGFLVSFHFVKKKNQNQIRWWQLYLHRYLRLTPMYMILTMLWFSLNPLLRNLSPFWHQEGFDKVCKKYWWTNLLYINNIPMFLQEGMCYGISWYLACDMQFFIISPVILYLLYHKLYIGLSVSFLMILAHFGYMIWSTITFNLRIGMQIDSDGMWVLMNYLTPIAWIGPYLIGLLGGFFFATTSTPSPSKTLAIPKSSISSHDISSATSASSSSRGVDFDLIPELEPLPSQKDIHTTSLPSSTMMINLGTTERLYRHLRLRQICGWSISLVSFFLITLLPLIPTAYGPPLASSAANLIFMTFTRCIWALALLWLIWECGKGRGGAVNAMLSSTIFKHLARFSYSTFLFHYIVHMCYSFSQQTAVDFTLLSLLFMSSANVLLSFAGGFLLSLVIEQPLHTLTSIVIGRKKNCRELDEKNMMEKSKDDFHP